MRGLPVVTVVSLFCDATKTVWSSRSVFESTIPSTSCTSEDKWHWRSAAGCVARRDEVVAVAWIEPDFVGAS